MINLKLELDKFHQGTHPYAHSSQADDIDVFYIKINELLIIDLTLMVQKLLESFY